MIRFMGMMVVGGLLQAVAAQTDLATPEQAQSSAAFLDSIGVNTHFTVPDTGAEGTSYGNPEAILRELRYVHILHLRDSLFIGPNLAKMDLASRALGAKFDLVYDNYRHDGGQDGLAGAIANVASRPALVEAIEGPNEPDQFGLHYDGLFGAPAVVAAQNDLSEAVRHNPRLSAIPVLCPALSFPASGGMANHLGDLGPWCDVSTAHVYTENLTLGPLLPFDYIAKWSAFPLSFAPGRPRMITEGGWSTATANAAGVDEATQAKYSLTYLLDAFSQGIQRSYLYELSDDGIDTTNANSEFHNGIFHYDGTPKPAATMLARLNAVLGDGDGAPGSLSYAVAGMTASSHRLLLRRADGTFVLALWHEQYLWDRTAHAARRTAPVAVSVSFGQPVRSVDIYDPVCSGVERRLELVGQSVAFKVPDHPLLLLINSGDDANAPPRQPSR